MCIRDRKTDVKETDDGYEVDVDLPGFKKDEIHLELKDGYLAISAEKSLAVSYTHLLVFRRF